MTTLKPDVKLFIVKALASFDAPTEVCRQVKEEFGIEVSRQQVSSYDPNRRIAKDLSAKWRAVFERTRKAFLDDVSTIPIASQAFRLRAMQRMFERAQAQGNLVLSAQLLEQAAKEAGGAFTNRQRVDLQASITPTKSAQEMTDDELATIARAAPEQYH